MAAALAATEKASAAVREAMAAVVWCLENYIHPSLHREVFPGVDLPTDVKEEATEPRDWNPLDIRVTWLKNLTK